MTGFIRSIAGFLAAAACAASPAAGAGANAAPANEGMRGITSMQLAREMPMWWDTGALFDRRTGAQKEAKTIRLIVESAC